MASLEAHYSARDIEARILAALRAAGLNPEQRLLPEELGALDPATHAAVQCLTQILEGNSPAISRGLLEPGMGLISNNVLHDRAGFQDDASQRRLLYRARYYDRIRGTDWDE